MRRRRRAAFLVASAAALGVGFYAFAGSASGAPVVPSCNYVNSSGNKSCVKLQVTPSNATPALSNSQLGVRTRTLYAQPGNKPQGGFAKTVTLLFDNNFAITTSAGGANNCTTADVANKTVAQAYAACGPAGKNTYLSPPNNLSGKASTAPPSNFGVCTMAFKGPTANQILLYARVFTVANSNPACNSISNPGGGTLGQGNVTVVLTGTIANAGVAGFGKKLTVPNIDQQALPLDDFYATIKRGAYFKAQCPPSPWNLRGTFAYSGGPPSPQPNDTINTTQACTSPDWISRLEHRANDVARGAAIGRPSGV
jgi:hypothetical protein